MKDNFNVLIVEPNTIDQHDWAAPDYIRLVLDEKYSKFVSVPRDQDEYLKSIANLLNYKDFNQPEIESHIIGIEKDYIYEITYMKYTPAHEKIENIKPNGVGILFDQQGDDIFNNIIFQKCRNSLDGYERYYEDITISDLENLMRKRLWTNVVIYDDDEFREEEITGPLDKFAEIFFEEDICRIKQKEFAFLKHNINIWYLVDNDFGTENVCGNLLENNPKIFKCFFFTKITEDRRDNLTVEEVEKIIELSKNMDDFVLEIKDEDIETFRKNKYQILWEYYDKIILKK